MKSYPSSEDVFIEIGEKSIAAFARSVTSTREDLAEYRRKFPQWVADHSERGLANWINDRLWAHLAALVDGLPDVHTFEKGATREVIVGVKYKFRLKRHDNAAGVASYETLGFIEFVTQNDNAVLDGMEEIKLIAGYQWDKLERAIGDPVISLRDGKDTIIWAETLPEVPDEGVGRADGGQPSNMPDRDGPTGTAIDLSDRIGQKAKETPEET